jgi:hypothetical protein
MKRLVLLRNDADPFLSCVERQPTSARPSPATRERRRKARLSTPLGRQSHSAPQASARVHAETRYRPTGGGGGGGRSDERALRGVAWRDGMG